MSGGESERLDDSPAAFSRLSRDDALDDGLFRNCLNLYTALSYIIDYQRRGCCEQLDTMNPRIHTYSRCNYTNNKRDSYHTEKAMELLDSSSQIILSDLQNSILGVFVLGNQWFTTVIGQPRIILRFKENRV